MRDTSVSDDAWHLFTIIFGAMSQSILLENKIVPFDGKTKLKVRI